MHQIKLSNVNQSESALTQAVLQVSQMLGLFHAELASILKLQCGDVGELASAKKTLNVNSIASQKAEKLILIFEKLYVKFQGDEALMCNWLRRKNSELDGAPLYLMVDDGLIDNCLEYLQRRETCE